MKCFCCFRGPKTPNISSDTQALEKLQAELPTVVLANERIKLGCSKSGAPALRKLGDGILIYDQYLDDAATPREFFDKLLGFLDHFVLNCPRNGAVLLGAIVTQSLNARDGYEKASREVYYWCVAALPLLEAFEDALQSGRINDAQLLLLSVYEHGTTIMHTVASALAKTTKHLELAMQNATDLSRRMAFQASTPNTRSIGCATTSNDESLLAFGAPPADAGARITTYGRPAAVDEKLSDLLQVLAKRMELMLKSIDCGWNQLQRTHVIETLDDERRQPNLLKFLDQSTMDKYLTSASALRTTCSDFMRRHAQHQAV
ncbi:hypothetical protein SDRG_11387 [Saprolegnia diclina VS20]|uniref:Uncharacterized protein n=1 Tax=Saprolegnia diclina (strain VS20) TaxID=1156394 RepID=T0RLN6_SAPDV|nr:hypothetical protein SDRG_11387 [Saprolegnia diclina VS20]EQC30907.1 hypothetical protein SDRG_11387 [Saprolegnia diclina VS20]|eukprot:XP_008615645.1 hypothetical protein SDRG_11387 [Saprolegnia diclina VS20]